MPTLSLCLIAKNEEGFLPGCLKSVADVVDQMVVVDTGSTDATPEIAAAAGALVVHRAWDDDFSAARNAALDAATGDFVLVLDADERLVGGSALRSTLDGPLDVGMLSLHNADALDAPFADVLDGSRRLDDPVLLPRIFRRTPDLRWEGRIHEQPRTWLLGERRVSRVDGVAIVHLGSVPAVREGRAKRARNIRLLRAHCAEAPDDVTAWGFLASDLLDDGRADEGRAALEAGWSALSRLAPGHRASLVRLLTLRATRKLADGDAEEALETVRARTQDHANLWYLEAVALSRLAPARSDGPRLRRDALSLLDRCLAWDGEAAAKALPGVGGYAAWTLRGELLLAEGRLDEAVRAFDAAALGHPEPQRPALGRIEAKIRRGRASEALSTLEPLLDESRPDSWILAALASRDLGQPRDLIALVARADQLVTKGFWAAHRARDLAELRAEAGLYRGQPVSAPGEVGRLVALSFRVPDPADPVPAARAGQIAVNLSKLGRAHALEPWLEPRGDARVPGLGNLVQATLAEHGMVLHDDDEPDLVFVGGAGRSGTTLFRAMLDAHPRIHCGPEIKLVPPLMTQVRVWRETLATDLAAAGVDPSLLDDAARAFVRTLLEGRAPAGLRVAEKTPHNLLHLAALGRLFPRARFLHVIRDGRAVTASLLRQDWRDPSTGERIAWCRDVASASAYWAEVVEGIRAQAPSVPGRYLEVRYEDLVVQPEAEMQRVLAFLGEAWDDAVLAHERAGVALSQRESSSAAVASAIHRGAVDRWREDLSDDDLLQLVPQATQWIERLGYASA